MAQRFLLLGFVGSGLALNAFGISHFNTSEMSSIFETGNVERDSSAEADTGGRPGFDVKAMVKNLFKAGNHLLVPMEMQTNRRMGRILRHIMAEVHEATNVQYTSLKCCMCSEKIETHERRCPVSCKEKKCTMVELAAKLKALKERETKLLAQKEINETYLFKEVEKITKEEGQIDEEMSKLKADLEAEKNILIGKMAAFKTVGMDEKVKKLKNQKKVVNGRLKDINAEKAKTKADAARLQKELQTEQKIKSKPKTNLKITTPDSKVKTPADVKTKTKEPTSKTEQKIKSKPAVTKAKTGEFTSNLETNDKCGEPPVPVVFTKNDQAGEASEIDANIKKYESKSDTLARKALTASMETIDNRHGGFKVNMACTALKSQKQKQELEHISNVVKKWHCRACKVDDAARKISENWIAKCNSMFKKAFPDCGAEFE